MLPRFRPTPVDTGLSLVSLFRLPGEDQYQVDRIMGSRHVNYIRKGNNEYVELFKSQLCR